jgi:hypothetical protein
MSLFLCYVTQAAAMSGVPGFSRTGDFLQNLRWSPSNHLVEVAGRYHAYMEKSISIQTFY